MVHYDYVYIICCNSGSERYIHTLPSHFSFLEHYSYLKEFSLPFPNFQPRGTMEPPKSILVVISLRGDKNPAFEQKVQEFFSLQISRKDKITLLIDRRRNWGGTIGSLWDTWKYILEGKITAGYVALCEDDWICNNWPLREKLVNDGYIYVGMQLNCTDRIDFYWIRTGYRWVNCKDRSFQGQLEGFLGGKIDKYIWSDGGNYFFKYSSLAEIEKKIGIFTKAPLDEEYHWTNHGINYGEAGFPSNLHAVGYKIIVLGGEMSINAGRIFQPTDSFTHN